MADEVRRGRIERAQQGAQVVDVLAHRVVALRGDGVVRPVVAAAVGDRPEVAAELR